ncbi:MAG TPA: arginase [Tissierellaceae bacterium]|nr:arginase [Tissierellaceae bacterium]
MNINIIGVPIMYGCDRDGVQLGPDKLRELGIIEIFQNNNHNVYDMGNLFVPNVLNKDKFKDHNNMKYLEPIIDVNRNLAHSVYSSLKSDTFPLILGGDHSLALGSIAGSSKFYNRMAVIWLDAHGDINDFNSSPSGNIHGMPLAASMNVGDPRLTNLYQPKEKVFPEDVYIIGIRDLDPGEISLAEELNINLYTMDDIESKGLDNILKKVLQNIHLSKVDGVHLSFDIDVLDDSLVPGTGTPVKDGFTLEKSKYIMKEILNTDLITSMDFVELNPKLDHIDKRTEKIAIDLLEFIGENL